MAKTKAKKHPFLFYGYYPGDWTEGPQLWLIRFVTPPTEEVRGRLGEAAAEVLQGQPLTIESLLFAEEGPWGALTSEDSEDEPFAAAGVLALALHELAPIAEVILATAREPGDSGWDRWTEKQQALPSVISGVLHETGDQYTRIDTHFRTRGTDDDYPARCEAEAPIPVQPSAAFDGALKDRVESLFRAALEEALVKAKKGGKPALVPVTPGLVQPPALPQEQVTRIGPHTSFAVAASGRVVAIASGTYYYHFAVLDPGAEEPRRIEVNKDIPTKCVALSPSGNHVLFVAQRDLIEVDLSTGEQQVVFQLPGYGPVAFSAGYLDSDDRVLAQWNDEVTALLLRSAPSRGLDLASNATVKGVGLVTLRGRLGFLSDNKTMRVVGVHGETIAALGNLPVRLGSRVFEAEQDGVTKVFVRQEARIFEVYNLEAAYDKKLKKTNKKTNKKRPR